jgi:hypothetical protein
MKKEKKVYVSQSLKVGDLIKMKKVMIKEIVI